MHNEKKYSGSRSEVRGLFVLLVGIIILLVIRHLLNFENRKFAAYLKEYVSINGKNQPDSVSYNKGLNNYSSYRKKKNIMPYRPFDPNTDDYIAMVRAGIPAKVAGNIIAYRSKGGKFITPEDLLIIYGMDSDLYTKIKLLIKINSMHQVKEQYAFHPTNPVFRIDLNIADTSDLSRLPGVGPVLSERIIRYRSALGGFFSPAQLTEVYGISDSLYNCIGNYLLADTMNIQKLDLNSVSLKQLEKHPYIGNYEAKAIISYRRLSGPFKHPDELIKNYIVTFDNYNKIRHYLTAN